MSTPLSPDEVPPGESTTTSESESKLKSKSKSESTDIERLMLLGLNATSAAGMREVVKLRSRIDDLRDLDRPGVLSRVRGLRIPVGLRRRLGCGELESLGQEALAAAEALGVGVTLFGDDDWPTRLDVLANPPIALYRRGHWNDQRRAVAIVR